MEPMYYFVNILNTFPNPQIQPLKVSYQALKVFSDFWLVGVIIGY